MVYAPPIAVTKNKVVFLAVRASSVSQRSSSEAGKEAATSARNDAYLDQTIVSSKSTDDADFRQNLRFPLRFDESLETPLTR